MKSSDALLLNDADMPYSPASKDLHYAMEMVVALGQGGADILAENALSHVWGYAAGLDMTRRDVQNAAKKEGKPWDMGKGFDFSAAIGKLVAASQIGHPTTGLIELKINGAIRQTSNLSKMIWNVSEMISYLFHLFAFAPGDLIYTGTPKNVAVVQRGDVLEGIVSGVGAVRTKIV